MSETQQTDGSVLSTLFAHNRWANLKLLDFCEKLSVDQLDSATVGGYGSIRDTLVHLVSAEVSYVRRVNGKQPPAPFVREPFPGFESLKETAAWTSDELLQLALATSAQSVVREGDSEENVEYPLACLMMQAINHATEHRSQIATIITQLGLEPPDMSGWVYMEENGEFKIFKKKP